MKLFKQKNKLGNYDIILEKDGKQLIVSLQEDNSLSWKIISNYYSDSIQKENDFFVISKDNPEIYKLFEILYYNISRRNIFNPRLIDSPHLIQEERDNYRREYFKFSKIFNEREQTISWFSDDANHLVSNILKIKKIDNIFLVEFYVQPSVKGFEKKDNLPGTIEVTISSSTYYNPYNLAFFEMYHGMQEIIKDDEINQDKPLQKVK